MTPTNRLLSRVSAAMATTDRRPRSCSSCRASGAPAPVTGTEDLPGQAARDAAVRCAGLRASDRTTIRWTGNAGFFVNSRGTTFMIDPLLQGFDMPILIDMPIRPKDVPRLDAVLVTHSDNDHYSVPTLRTWRP